MRNLGSQAMLGTRGDAEGNARVVTGSMRMHVSTLAAIRDPQHANFAGWGGKIMRGEGGTPMTLQSQEKMRYFLKYA
jgi:hypothetical protein